MERDRQNLDVVSAQSNSLGPGYFAQVVDMPEDGLGASLLISEVRADADNPDDAAAFRAG